MRKEVLIAIVAGIAFGVTIAFGIWRTNIALKPQQTSTEHTSKEQKGNENNNPGIELAIAGLQDNDVITESPIQISGITQENSHVVISTEKEDFVVKTEDGEFSEDVELSGGLNQILVYSFDSLGNVAIRNINLIFSTQFESNTLSEDKDVNESSEEADLVRQKVREKLTEAQNNPKAYLGTITDITEETIQIQGENGEIQQITTRSDTSYVQLSETSKELDFEDVAIGDYIIALGYVDENNVLETIRILVTDELSEADRTISFGKVLEIENKILTIETSDEEIEAVFPRRWKGPEIVEIEDESVVIIVTFIDQGKRTIRTIEIVD